jgi:NADH-quinone oxidoreductase subunit E
VHEVKQCVLTDEMRAAIAVELKKYPDTQKKSASLAAIMIVQDLGEGWVTNDQLDSIAMLLEVTPIEMYEVATFYTMCKRDKVAKHTIEVCTNVPCMLNGAESLAAHIKKRVGVTAYGEITQDGRLSVEEVECLGACVNAPMCQIGKSYHERLTPEKIDRIIDELE